MKSTKQDPRARRTRQLLGSALTALILEKRYTDITIQDILDRAEVSRSTFYAHYYDKDDLLISEFEHVLQSMASQVDHHPGSAQALFPSLALLKHIQARHDLYDALTWGRGAQVLFDAGHALFSRNLESQLRALTQDKPAAVPVPVLAEFIGGAFVVLMKWWLDNKMPCSPERMDEMFRQLVMPGVHAALG